MEEIRLYEMYLNEAIEEKRIDLFDKNLKYKNLKININIQFFVKKNRNILRFNLFFHCIFNNSIY